MITMYFSPLNCPITKSPTTKKATKFKYITNFEKIWKFVAVGRFVIGHFESGMFHAVERFEVGSFCDRSICNDTFHDGTF